MQRENKPDVSTFQLLVNYHILLLEMAFVPNKIQSENKNANGSTQSVLTYM